MPNTWSVGWPGSPEIRSIWSAGKGSSQTQPGNWAKSRTFWASRGLSQTSTSTSTKLKASPASRSRREVVNRTAWARQKGGRTPPSTQRWFRDWGISTSLTTSASIRWQDRTLDGSDPLTGWNLRFLLALVWIDACANMPSDWDKCSDSECRRESQLSAYDQPSSIAETLLIKTLCQSIQLYQSITLCLKDSHVFFYTTDCSSWLTKVFMCKGGHENVVAISCGCIIVEQWKHCSF